MVKNPSANAGHLRDIGLIPGSERSPGERDSNPLQYSCLENPHEQRSLAQVGYGSLVVKLCPTLATPWIVARQAPLSMGSPRQEYWNGLSFLSPGGLPNPGIKPMSPPSPPLWTDSLPLSHLGSPLVNVGHRQMNTWKRHRVMCLSMGQVALETAGCLTQTWGSREDLNGPRV